MITCVGCNRSYDWDGKDILCMTCICGSLVFKSSTGTLFPASLYRVIVEKPDNPPHIDYYLGNSDYTSPLKESMISELEKLGLTWMKDCEQCQSDGTLERHQERAKARR